METKTNKTTELKKWLDSLTVKEYSKTEFQIMTECGISRYTLWRWKRGKTEPSYLAKKKINEIAGKEIYPI